MCVTTQATTYSFTVCVKVQMIFIWDCTDTEQPTWECNNSPWTILPTDWRSHTSGIHIWRQLVTYYSCFLRKERLKCGDELKQSIVNTDTSGQSVISGGWRGSWRRSHSKQFRNSINNVCCLYELWTMKGFYCLLLIWDWINHPERREHQDHWQCIGIDNAGCMGGLSAQPCRDNFVQC